MSYSFLPLRDHVSLGVVIGSDGNPRIAQFIRYEPRKIIRFPDERKILRRLGREARIESRLG